MFPALDDADVLAVCPLLEFAQDVLHDVVRASKIAGHADEASDDGELTTPKVLVAELSVRVDGDGL